MDKLLSAQQVADHLGMHPKTLYKALRENRMALNFIRLGRTIAFRPADVEAYLNAREVARTGDGPRKRRKQTLKEQLSRKYKIVDIMTNEEAERFFAKVSKRVSDDGRFIELEGSVEGEDE
jgi:excisionase family DNA binding protein